MVLRHKRFDARMNAVQSLNGAGADKACWPNPGRFNRYAAKSCTSAAIKIVGASRYNNLDDRWPGPDRGKRMQEQGGQR